MRPYNVVYLRESCCKPTFCLWSSKVIPPTINIAGIESDSGIGVTWPKPLIVLLKRPKSFSRRPVVTKKYFVQQLNQIQSLKSIPKIGVPHLPQKRCSLCN